MAGVGTHDLFSGVSRLNTLGKLKSFLQDLKLTVQKVDMPENVFHFWNSLSLNMVIITQNLSVQSLSRPLTHSADLRVKLSDHCELFPLRISCDSLLSKDIDIQNIGSGNIRLCIINPVLGKYCNISSV